MVEGAECGGIVMCESNSHIFRYFVGTTGQKSSQALDFLSICPQDYYNIESSVFILHGGDLFWNQLC